MENYENVFQTICRTCLSYGNSENMVSLTDNAACDGLSTYGKSVLSFTNTSYNIRFQNNSLPNKMCTKCLFLLKQAIIFRTTCKNSNKKLIKFLDNLGTKSSDFKKKLCDYVVFLDNSQEECLSEPEGDPLIETDPALEKGSATLVKIENSDDDDKPKIEHENAVFVKNEVNIEDSSVIEQEVVAFGKDEIDIAQNSIEKDTVEFVKEENTTDHDLENELHDSIKNDVSSNNEYTDDDNLGSKLYLEMQQKDTESPSREKRKNRRAAKKNKVKKEDQSATESDEQESKDKEYCPGDNTSNNTDEDIELESDDDRPKKKRKTKKLTNTNTYVQCKICNKSLTKPYMKDHMMRHNVDKRWICDQCGNKFITVYELKSHLTAIHDVSPLICKTCGHKAIHKTSLKEHNRIHTGERPYKCDECGLTFYRRNTFMKHILLHKEKTIKCPKCPKMFHIKTYMISHYNSIHQRMHMFACNQCDATYASALYVRKHLTNQHGIPKEAQGKIEKIELAIPPPVLNLKRKRNMK